MRNLIATARIAVAALLALGVTADLSAQQLASRGLVAHIALSTMERQYEPVERWQDDDFAWGRAVLRVGQDYALKQGESVREVMVIFSPATIEGHVRGDVVVVLGTVQIAPTAIIGGSLIVAGGNVTVQQGAAVRRDLVVIGGGLDAPAGFMPGGQHVAIGATVVADGLRSVVPWITGGLLLGRPIVPSLPWVWMIVFATFALSVVLLLLFLAPVQTAAQTFAARPMTTFLTGLLVLLLIGPVAIILAASVIGLAVVPFLLCAVVIAWIVGKIAISVRLGDGMLGQTEPGTRFQTLRSFVLGFAVVCLVYMIPVLGLITWALIGVTGLGAATMAFLSAYRRENPARPKAARPPDPPPPPPSAGPVDPVDNLPPLPMDPMPTPSAHRIAESPSATGLGSGLLAFPKSGFAERAAALALDTIFVLIACGAVGLLDDDQPNGFILAMLSYHIGFWAWKGTTFGGIVCQLRLTRTDGTTLRFVDALVRGIASLFSLGVAGLGFLWILKDEDRQAWHDKIAGTYVVSVPKNWPLA